MPSFLHIKARYGLLLMLFSPAVWADSYRFLHVTIETPWLIFLFLLPIVMSPFILMLILYWVFAARRRKQARDDSATDKNQI